MLAASGSPSSQIRVKCLLVDDLEDNIAALSAIMRRDDVELFSARSGAEALDLLLTHDMALAILDVQMPEMDGFQLAELMRGSERTRHVPIIFVTAGARDPVRLFRGYDQGAVDFLYKPIDASILLTKADVFFEIYRQRKQLAQELEARTQTLHLNEIFMGILGHDLRDPLNAIMLNAQLLKTIDDPLARDLASSITRSGQRMGRMIQDLLDVTRTRLGGGLEAVRKPGSLFEAVDAALQELAEAGEGNFIELEAEGDFEGEWDCDRITQAVSNLASNAITHGCQDSPVRLYVDGRHDDVVVLSVTNKGEIPAALLPRIFEPFTTESTRARRSGSLGLGLYIVQQIVQSHGGYIDVQSGNGITHFALTLPRQCSLGPKADELPVSPSCKR